MKNKEIIYFTREFFNNLTPDMASKIVKEAEVFDGALYPKVRIFKVSNTIQKKFTDDKIVIEIKIKAIETPKGKNGGKKNDK